MSNCPILAAERRGKCITPHTWRSYHTQVEQFVAWCKFVALGNCTRGTAMTDPRSAIRYLETLGLQAGGISCLR